MESNSFLLILDHFNREWMNHSASNGSNKIKIELAESIIKTIIDSVIMRMNRTKQLTTDTKEQMKLANRNMNIQRLDGRLNMRQPAGDMTKSQYTIQWADN